MHCPDCHTEYSEKDIYCRQCGVDLQSTSRSIVARPPILPAVLYHSPVPRRVAAGVGALALGVGIELLRRTMQARLRAPRASKSVLPGVGDIKDLLLPQQEKSLKLPRGYEVHETVVYMRRVIRRTR